MGRQSPSSGREIPTNIKYGDAGTKHVVEFTGVFTTREKGGAHLKQGAKSVIISVPFADAPMLVMGVSHEMDNNLLKKGCQQHQLLSPLAKVIHINFIIVEGFMTTVHDIADTQKTLDNSLGSYGMMAVELPRR